MNKFTYMTANFMSWSGASQGALAMSIPGLAAGAIANGVNINSQKTPDERAIEQMKANRFNDAFLKYQDNKDKARQDPRIQQRFNDAGNDFVDYNTDLRKKYSNPLLQYGLPAGIIGGGALLGAKYLR